jgi:hypothetical protein
LRSYLTIDKQGLILEIKLTAATLLGVARGALVNKLTNPLEDADGELVFRVVLIDITARKRADEMLKNLNVCLSTGSWNEQQNPGKGSNTFVTEPPGCHGGNDRQHRPPVAPTLKHACSHDSGIVTGHLLVNRPTFTPERL